MTKIGCLICLLAIAITLLVIQTMRLFNPLPISTTKILESDGVYLQVTCTERLRGDGYAQ